MKCQYLCVQTEYHSGMRQPVMHGVHVCTWRITCTYRPASCLPPSLPGLFFLLLSSFLIWISIFCSIYDGLSSRKWHEHSVAFEPVLQTHCVLSFLLTLDLSSVLPVNFDMCKLIIIQSKWVGWPLIPHDILRRNRGITHSSETWQFNERIKVPSCYFWYMCVYTHTCMCACVYKFLPIYNRLTTYNHSV